MFLPYYCQDGICLDDHQINIYCDSFKLIAQRQIDNWNRRIIIVIIPTRRKLSYSCYSVFVTDLTSEHHFALCLLKGFRHCIVHFVSNSHGLLIYNSYPLAFVLL